MSAVWDTLTEEAREREEGGFTTMRPTPIALLIGAEEPWSTANDAVVGSGAALGSIVVAYGAPRISRGTSMWGSENNQRQAQIVRSHSYLIELQGNTATMAGGSLFQLDTQFEPERGVVVLKMPRKIIHSEHVSFFMSNLKRKTPRIVFGGRGEDEE